MLIAKIHEAWLRGVALSGTHYKLMQVVDLP
jgi:hypothetical protein